ncbi:polyhydroxyalkanoic acid system family protein [Chenggangzhangella methanolivorans]|uniref:Polyhydroxyalkanoic acid system family protein n=1 Tax=Chenggangzhangella methanolivorans TaxID=1437009 RepID=A0A9E6RF11_9HYPH|nr:polyhydroxyalkanoic acid system family protein [Chenggangzhangella methanolivorans]QZO00021.1 polyhydroxyalkanoic acid system family protein [Chenggangzhangella methanolivorans]
MQFEVPHSLGKSEARRRIENGLPALEKHIPGGGTVASTWTAEDRLSLTISAMGQSIDVAIEVEDAVVRGDIDVPMMLSMMSGAIRDFVEKSSRIMLEKGGEPAKA